MQTRDLFLTCSTDTLLAHRAQLLEEAKLVDEILVSRQEQNRPGVSSPASPTIRHECDCDPLRTALINAPWIRRASRAYHRRCSKEGCTAQLLSKTAVVRSRYGRCVILWSSSGIVAAYRIMGHAHSCSTLNALTERELARIGAAL